MKNVKQNMQRQRGFTLVELAIVLVVIGLIIGGVLTAQQVIQNARITNTINAIQAYQSQFQTYQQNFNALPGDDSTAANRFPNAGVTSGDGSGTIQGNFDSTTATDESVLAWADLRAAGFVKNQVPATGQPANPFNGIYGFQNGFNGVFTTTVLCLNNIPGAVAQAVDTRLDDATANAGSIQAIETPAGGGTTGTLATAYAASSNYTLCMKM